MMQLNLFEAARMNHRALQMAIEKMDPRRAQDLLGRIPHQESLDWELDALRFLETSTTPRDLDTGWRAWLRLKEESWFNHAPRPSALEFRKSFLRRLLAACPAQRKLLVTPAGLSVGHLLLLAGCPRQARRRLERELASNGDFAETRLHLAHAFHAMSMTAPARAHFREALLAGWERLDAESIPDAALLKHLLGADDPDWAVIEACLEGVLPVARFSSLEECRRFFDEELQTALESAPPDDLVPRRRQFYLCLVVSANRRWADSQTLIRSRLRMKELHPRLHAAYMRSLETAQTSR